MPQLEMVEIIGLIYSAVDEPERWPVALQAVSDGLGAAVLMGRTHRGAACDELMSSRLPPEPVQSFRRLFGLERPVAFIQSLPARPLASPLTPEQFEGEAAFLASPVYNEVFKPHGYRYIATAVLHREPGWLSYVTLARVPEEGPFASVELDQFEMVAGHLGRAVALHHSLAAARAGGLLLADVIDRFDRGAIVCDSDGRPRLLNRLAREIVERGDGLTLHGQALRTTKRGTSAELLRLIQDCAATSAGSGTEAGGVIAVERRDGSQAYAVIVSPLATSMLAGIDNPALALVLIADPERRVPPQEQLQQLHRLTPAEARVAARLMLGDTAAATAATLGISINTVRYHLRNLLAKTGTRRQAELVAHLRAVS